MKKVEKLLVLVLISCLLTSSYITTPVFAETASDEESSFSLRNGIMFGDTLEDIKSKETFVINEKKSFYGEDDDKSAMVVTEEVTISGYDGYITFLFDKEGKLNEMGYTFSKISNQDNTNRYDVLKSSLSRKYGDPLDINDGFYFPINTVLFYLHGVISQEYNSGEIQDYDEWVVDINKKEHVKIDLFSVSDKGGYNSKTTYETNIAYKYYTDEELAEAVQSQKEALKEEQEAIDKDL